MTPTTAEFLKAWYIFSFSLGCWTCANLLISRRGEKRVKYTLVIFILLLLTPPLNAYIQLVTAHPIRWIELLSQKLTWCYGPIMVALIRHMLLQPISRISYSVQALPFSLSFLHEMFKLDWISFPIMVSLLFIQLLCYLAYAGYLLKSERTKFLTLTTQHKNTTYYWLTYLVMVLFLLTLFDIFIFSKALLDHIPSRIVITIIASLIAVFVNTIALFSLYQPDVFFHNIKSSDEPMAELKPPLRSVELSPEAAKDLDNQLQQLIKSHKPHLDENISLPKLASLLGVTTHQLSELLNVHKSTNFYDFLNDLRYQESLQLLAQKNCDLTIADIAYRSGFNNRNSFYNVFKGKTGLTPSQYKKTVT